VRFRNKTHQQFLDIFFRNEKLKEILGSGWGYLGLNNPKISALYFTGMYMSYHTGGAWYPTGGYQSMSDAFAQCFRENGGILRVNTKVKKVLVEGNRAVGVELDDGEQLRTGCVISNADTKRTFLDLVGEEKLEKGFAERVKRLQQSVSGFVVHLGVQMELPEELHCGCVMYFPGYGIAEDQFREAARNGIVTVPGKFGFGLSVATLKDPSLAPAGCHALDIISMPAPYGYEHNWMRGDRTKYDELKERTADTLIRAAEKLIPGLSRHIVVKDISTPLTYEKYTSATEGGWYDSACTPGQSLLNRMPAKTPIENLYLTGAKSFPGPGMFGAIQSGLFTADIILNRKLTKGKYVLDIQ
jgi:phytoene dehydrogenase-like protein